MAATSPVWRYIGRRYIATPVPWKCLTTGHHFRYAPHIISTEVLPFCVSSSKAFLYFLIFDKSADIEIDSETATDYMTSLRDAEYCRCKLKALAERLRLQQHDLHSLEIIEELEDEVVRAVNASNALSDYMAYYPVNVKRVNATVLNSLKKDWFRNLRTNENGILKLDRGVHPLVQIEPQRYLLPNKHSLTGGTFPNLIHDGRLTIECTSSTVVLFLCKKGSLEGAMMQL